MLVVLQVEVGEVVDACASVGLRVAQEPFDKTQETGRVGRLVRGQMEFEVDSDPLSRLHGAPAAHEGVEGMQLAPQGSHSSQFW